MESAYRWVLRLPWAAFIVTIALLTTTRRGTIPYEIGQIAFGFGLGGLVMAIWFDNYNRWRNKQGT
jgi:hypothetical protein